MKDRKPLLILFAKEPVLGKVKTRLTSKFSEEEALSIHKTLLKFMLTRLSQVKAWDTQIYIEGSCDHPFLLECAQEFQLDLKKQQGEDLGAKMFQALDENIKHRSRVVIVGADCVSVDREYLTVAFESLIDSQCVIGPSDDGGYVLVGASQTIDPKVFSGVEWGSGRAYAQTLANFEGLNIDFTELELAWDVDTPEDFERFQDLLASQ